MTARKALILLVHVVAASVLAGCAHERVVIQTVETKVPVPVPCVVALPDEPERHSKKEATDIFVAMKNALAEIEGWEGWALKAKAASAGCASAPPKDTPPNTMEKIR